MNKACDLCPRRCNAARFFSVGKADGFCKAPGEIVVSRASLHHWEEPVISGDRGSGTVFFSGCNLHCVFCQNHEISSVCKGTVLSSEELRKLFFRLIDRGAHNINLVTPGHFLPLILPALEEKLPVPTVYNSNGYESVETLRMAEGKIDVFLPDLKYADNDLALKYSHAGDYFETAQSAIKEMLRQTGNFVIGDDGIIQKGVIIRHLILPGALENTLRVIDFVAENFRPGEVMFSLMRQYLPCGLVSDENYPELNRRVSDLEYEIAEEALLASGIEDGFVQDADSAVREFIPDFSADADDQDVVSLR